MGKGILGKTPTPAGISHKGDLLLEQGMANIQRPYRLSQSIFSRNLAEVSGIWGTLPRQGICDNCPQVHSRGCEGQAGIAREPGGIGGTMYWKNPRCCW